MHAKDCRVRGGRGPGRAKWLEIVLDKLPAMPLAQLRELWVSSQNSQPQSLPEALLRRLLAQRLQEHCHGGLPRAVARELERLARGEQPAETPRSAPAVGPGTRLIREWNGRTIAVQVREDGYVWEDRVYSSLSKIACEVTGAKWSGSRFFGLARNG